MNFLQVKELISRSRQDHLRVAQAVRDTEILTLNERSSEIMNYFIRHQTNIARHLKSFLDNSSESVLNSWFQYIPDFTSTDDLLESLHEEITDDELAQLLAKINGDFSDRYKKLVQHSSNEQVRETLKHILELELHETNETSWQILSFHDT